MNGVPETATAAGGVNGAGGLNLGGVEVAGEE
jgi:hypothetical protein